MKESINTAENVGSGEQIQEQSVARACPSDSRTSADAGVTRKDRFMRVLHVGLYVIAALVFVWYWAASIPHEVSWGWSSHKTEFNHELFWAGVFESIKVLLIACVLGQCLSWRKRNRMNALHGDQSVFLQLAGGFVCLAGAICLLVAFYTLTLSEYELQHFFAESAFSGFLNGGGIQMILLLKALADLDWSVHLAAFVLLVGGAWMTFSIGVVLMLLSEVLASICGDNLVSRKVELRKRIDSVRERLASLLASDVKLDPLESAEIGPEALDSLSKALTDHFQDEESNQKRAMEMEDEWSHRLRKIEVQYDELETESQKRKESEKREKSQAATVAAKGLFSENKFAESLEKLDEALQTWPENEEARTFRKTVFPKSPKGIALRKWRIRVGVMLLSALLVISSIAVLVNRHRAEAARIEAERRAEAARIEAERRAEAAPLTVKEFLDQMVDIPGKDFKMCKYEVTQALWEAVMGENPSDFKGANRPVENVSWNDCQEFLEKLNANPEAKKSGLVFRLPTEEEWEYACRAGSAGDYCKMVDGSEITEETLGTVAWYKENSNGETHPVGQKQPNAFGLYDMLGNVFEWTSTTDGVCRVFRGGSLHSNAVFCTCGDRYRYIPDDRGCNLGLRLVASAGL